MVGVSFSRNCRARNKGTVLPVDIMISIFFKLQVKPLFRCQCVCKSWRNVINNSYFADKYRKSSIARQSQLIRFSYSCEAIKVYAINPQLSISKHPIEEFHAYKRDSIKNIGHGLFLIEGDDLLKVPSTLYNPLRDEKLILPLVENSVIHDHHYYGLGFNSSTKQYKLVRISITYRRTLTQVYTLGESNKWKQITAVPPSSAENMNTTGIPAYGDIHWYVSGEIVSFTYTKEEFKVSPIPISVTDSKSCVLINWIEDLALLESYGSSHIEMWVLRDYENTRWEKLYTIPLTIAGLSMTNIITWEEDIVFKVTKERWSKDKMLPVGYQCTLYCCNPKTGDITASSQPINSTHNEFFHSYTINSDSRSSYGVVASTQAAKRKARGLYKHKSSISSFYPSPKKKSKRAL